MAVLDEHRGPSGAMLPNGLGQFAQSSFQSAVRLSDSANRSAHLDCSSGERIVETFSRMSAGTPKLVAQTWILLSASGAVFEQGGHSIISASGFKDAQWS